MWLTCVGHRERTRCIRVLRDVLVPDTATVKASLHGTSLQVLESAIRRTTRASQATIWILRMGTPKLIHEARYHAVEVKSVEKTRSGQIDEVGCCVWHTIKVDLGCDLAHCGVKDRNRVSRHDMAQVQSI
eukprot:TRINITY_DN79490_c0_g1_i1.p1 TRINITY_DN79490_c0_g1~~TRINITY_DN79490_c0_g1_i1.p1  ORF type:complete len:130 (-),score=1.75 TRINITY_DN79490_c0_g1_i1:37-426(-)